MRVIISYHGDPIYLVFFDSINVFHVLRELRG